MSNLRKMDQKIHQPDESLICKYLNNRPLIISWTFYIFWNEHDPALGFFNKYSGQILLKKLALRYTLKIH
jgi:hypothetical protein